MCGPARSAATSIFMIVSYNNPVTVYKSDPSAFGGGHIRCSVIREIGIYVSSVIVNIPFYLLLYHAWLIGDPRLYNGQCPACQFACNLYNDSFRVLGQMFSVIGLHNGVCAYGLP